jgi:hypothetical protein
MFTNVCPVAYPALCIRVCVYVYACACACGVRDGVRAPSVSVDGCGRGVCV